MNPLFLIPPPVPDIEQLEAQTKIQDIGQSENTPTKQKRDVFEERLRDWHLWKYRFNTVVFGPRLDNSNKD